MQKDLNTKIYKTIIMLHKKGYIQFLALAIFLILMTFLLINKTQDTSFLAFNIDGNGNSVFLRNMVIVNVKTPIINLFSPKNPVGTYTIDLQILDGNRNIVLFGKLTNIGTGQSIFKLNSYLEGDYIIKTTTYNNDKIIRPSEEYPIKTITSTT